MLHHESTPEVLPHPYTSHNASSLTSQEPEAITPQELAQAIVAVEKRQATSVETEAGSAVVQQAIAQSGVVVTPEQLLAEVHRQRGRSHENMAMTPRLTQNLTVRLLIAGVICSSLAALFLLCTSFVFANRLRNTNDKLRNANEALAKYIPLIEPNAPSSRVVRTFQSWKYPGALSPGSNQGTDGMISATLTTSDDYAKVWNFYAQQSGFTRTMLQHDPKFAVPDGTQSLSANGGDTQGGQTFHYDIQSIPTPTDRLATFTQSSNQHTVTAILDHPVGASFTTVHLVVSTPR